MDLGVSGSVPFADRPDGAKAIEHAPGLDRLYATKQDRLGRDTLDVLLTIKRFESAGCEVVLVDEPLADGALGKLQRNLYAGMAEIERDKFVQRGKDGARAKKRAARPNGGKRPYALRYRGRRGHPDPKGGLEVIASEKPIVIRIFAEFVAGRAAYRIARDLQADGIPTIKQGAKWRDSTVRGILENPKYVQYGIIDQATFDKAQGD